MPHLPSNDSDSQDNEPSFPGPVPKNWAPEHDTHLAHHWQDLTDSNALNSFKHTISHLHRPNDPSTKVNPQSYDIQFLHDRLFHLHGACQHESSFTDSNGRNRYFHPHWPRLQRGEIPLHMLELPHRPPPIIFMHHATKQMRCGHCGCETLYRCDAMAEEVLIRYGSVRRGRRLRREAILGLDLQRPDPKNFGQFWGLRKVQSARKAEVEVCSSSWG
ncbi:MAG: hypothetical protein LQ339_002820 [Xanthoria mediterranea]|nr:MAG: hypothetical protein LQ339_002820 [Xanthoria mediterranea]